MTDAEKARLREAARAAVADFPPLTEHAKDRIRRALTPVE